MTRNAVYSLALYPMLEKGCCENCHHMSLSFIVFYITAVNTFFHLVLTPILVGLFTFSQFLLANSIRANTTLAG